LMWRFFWICWMIFMGSIGGSFLKVMVITPGAMATIDRVHVSLLSPV
jgi:hypothetical protein